MKERRWMEASSSSSSSFLFSFIYFHNHLHSNNYHYHLGSTETCHGWLRMERDSSFAIFAGTVIGIDGSSIRQANVQVGDSNTYTDDKGYFRLEFNVEDQSEYKKLRIEKLGKGAITRDDECPNNELKYIMYDE